MLKKSICYSGFVGGPRSMGRVGQYLVSHLLARRERYDVHFLPWETDYMAGYWEEEVAALVITDPASVAIDQLISFCSIVDARQKHVAKETTPWLFYELNSLPETIVEDVNTNDHVYVTSTFVRQVFLQAGVTVPVRILGHGVDPAHYRFIPRSKGKPFVFLSIAEHTPRKNLPMLIRSFERAFAHDPDVRLFLKLGLHGEGDLRAHVTQEEKVKFLSDSLDVEADLVALYGQAHCFVLPTRAEGFGMPILEAMATGLPTIVTNYSGHLDFCSAANCYLINNRGLVESDPECFPYVASQWGDPDEEHLTALLREVYDHYDEALDKGALASKTILGSWTWDAQLSRAFP